MKALRPFTPSTICVAGHVAAHYLSVTTTLEYQDETMTAYILNFFSSALYHTRGNGIFSKTPDKAFTFLSDLVLPHLFEDFVDANSVSQLNASKSLDGCKVALLAFFSRSCGQRYIFGLRHASNQSTLRMVRSTANTSNFQPETDVVTGP